MFGFSCVSAVDSFGDCVGVCGLEKGFTGADGEDIFKELKFSFGPPIDSDKRIQEDNIED